MVARDGIYGDLHGDGQPVAAPPRSCTCHPDDRPDPCQKKHAASDCWRAAVYAETRQMEIALRGRDRQPHEQALLDYVKRVERALANVC